MRRILGVGTFGRVKLVVHTPTETTYALKCMRKAQVVATKQQSHVLNEKNILAMMEHPFILCLVQTYQVRSHPVPLALLLISPPPC